MTIDELAKLKKGDKLGWRGDVVTLDRVQAVVLDKGTEVRLNLEFLSVIPGPTLPPHVAELFEWDGEPKATGKTGVLWNEVAPQYVEFRSSGNPSTLFEWGLVPRNRKGSK